MRHPGFPTRPLLRPGVRVCRRSDGELQVGLDRRLAVVAPDSPAVRDLLEGLRHGVAPPPPASLEPAAVRLCAALLEKGLVVDADTWLPLLGDGADPDVLAGLTAVVADHGPAAERVLRRRRQVPVEVVAAGLERAAERCRRLLESAGLPAGPGVALLIGAAEPDRVLVDDWVRQDRPHLFLTVSEGNVGVGPFVVPGRTACLRCVDAHHSEHDPRRGLAVQQYAEATGRWAGLPEPIHQDLLDIAVGYAVRDLVSWADGIRPTTWSTTVQVDPRLELPRTPWPRHAGCGCSWGLAAAG